MWWAISNVILLGCATKSNYITNSFIMLSRTNMTHFTLDINIRRTAKLLTSCWNAP